MAASCEKILHHSVLDFEKKQANVTLTPKYIAVEHISHKQSDSGSSDVKHTTTYCQVISLDEVLAVHPHAPTTTKDKIQGGGAVYQAIELQPSPLSFDLYVLKRGSSHRLRHKVLTFTCKNHSTCAAWMDKIKDVLYVQGSSRPKHLLVFVNPFGGKKRAPKVFEKVRPFFDLAGITLDVIETQRQYHARDVLQEYDLSTVDGVVCVGGDGTFSEVLNGMLDRVNADEGIEQSFRHQPARPHLRIGVIPAGSTDAVVFTTTGNNDPVTSAFLIIIGASVGVDVTALYKQQEFVKYSITMTSYGYYGDLLADSERFRWMGPKRYNWSGFKKIVLNRAYEGEVSFLPADASNGHPRDGNMCFTGCVVCQRAGKEAEMAQKSLTKSASAPTFDLGSGEFSDGLWSDMDGWRQVTGKFVAINSVTMSCRCELSPEGMSPYTHLGDGCMDLILVSQCDRIDYIKHLSRIPRQNADQFDFSFVQVHRVKEFQFRPLQPAEEEVGAGEEAGPPAQGASSSTLSRTSNSSQESLKRSTSKNSVWNCDGEVVTHPNLHVQVHCQLVQLFARGVENQGRQEEKTCPISCNPCSRC